jgi:hypothetical protein
LPAEGINSRVEAQGCHIALSSKKSRVKAVAQALLCMFVRV